MDWGTGWLGSILVLVGALLAAWKRKRHFDRANPYGIEQFPSYWSKLANGATNGFLGIASLVLLTAGILILALRFESSWGWAILIPVYLFCLFMVIGT